MNVLEMLANAITAVSIWLAARNSVHTWITGITGSMLFGILFVQNQLYADATLQIFFIATSGVGWWQWLHPSKALGSQERPVTSTSRGVLALMGLAALVVTAAYGWLLRRFTNAYLPFVDSGVLALSVVAQCLLMQRKVEAWPAWLAVNTLSVALFASRGILITAFLYAAYWINGWYGWWTWRKQVIPAPASAT